MIEVPSPLGQPREIAEKMADLMREFSDDVKVDDMSNVFCRLTAGKGGRRIAVVTHTDTITRPQSDERPSWSLAEGGPFGKPGKVLVGPGAAAPKGELAAMLAAAKALSERKGSFEGEVLIGGYADDMRADLVSIDALLKEMQSGGRRIDILLQGEPSDNRVVLGSRGRMEVELLAEGVTSHAGSPRKGVNPAQEMADILTSIKALKLPVHGSLGPATLSPVGLSARGAPPLTPKDCVAVLDRRTVPGESTEAVTKQLQAVLQNAMAERPGLRVRLRVVVAQDAFEVSPSDAAAAAVQLVVNRVAGMDRDGAYVPFTSNVGHIQGQFGIPCVAIGPGNVDDLSTDHVEVEKMVEAGRIYLGSLVALLGSRE